MRVRKTSAKSNQYTKVQSILRATRRMLGLTQAEFAQLFDGYSPEVVKNWERGRTVPRADIFLKILKMRQRCQRKKRASKTVSKGR